MRNWIGIGISSVKGHTKHARPDTFFSQYKRAAEASPRDGLVNHPTHVAAAIDCSSHTNATRG